MKFGRRLLLVAFGLLIPLVVAEIALRVSSELYGSALLATRKESIDRAARRVLCVGDSNTFGVRVAAADSYPGQLEAMLRAVAPGDNGWQVVNRGVPGQNTAQILDSLPELLESIDPEWVIVLAGLNNTWNRATRLEDRDWIDRIRLLRLFRIAWNDLRAAERGGVDEGMARIERFDAESRPDEAELASRTKRDLVAIVELVRGSGRVPILMTYAGQHPHSRSLDEAARAAAAETGTLLVDHDRAFAGYVERYGYDAILFEDSHPAEAGYRLMARDLVAALEEAGLIVGELPPDRFEPTTFRELASLSVEHDEAGRPLRLRLHAEPKAGFQVYVSPTREPPLDLGTRRVPVGVHPWLEFCKTHPPFRGALDERGEAIVELPAPVVELAPGEQLFAAFVTLDPRPRHEGAVRSISPAVVLRRR